MLVIASNGQVSVVLGFADDEKMCKNFYKMKSWTF